MRTRYASFVALALAGGSLSCISLDEELVGTITTEYYATPAGLEAAVNAAYSQLRSYFGREEAMAITEFGTDMTSNGDQGGFKHFNNYTAALNASANQILFPWNTFYRGINTSNAIIERAPGTEGVDPAIKASRIAEAKFLRALSYFYLVQIYGDVHLTLTENKGVQTEATRTPAAEIYNAIIADLNDAITDLPATQPEAGRATQGAAQHLLAKVYLTRAYKSFAGPNDFQLALDNANAVINSGRYALVANFADLWCVARPQDPSRTGYCHAVGLNETNSEVVFTVQHSWDVAQFADNNGNAWHLYFLSFYDDRQGMTRDINNGRAFRRFRPTLFAVNLWQRWVGAPGASDVLDRRYDGSFQSVWIAVQNGQNAAGTCPLCTSAEPIVAGDTAMWHPGYAVGNAFRQSRKYWIVEPCTAEPCPATSTVGQYDEFRFPTLKKHQDNNRGANFNEEDGGKDIYVARFAETYLIAAEAALGLGNTAVAAQHLNTVRRRAAADPYKAMMEITPGQVTLDFILDERGRELYGEGHRWFDLVRTGKFLDRVRAHNFQAAPNVQAHHALRPIPQAQIDLSSTPFPQNPGY